MLNLAEDRPSIATSVAKSTLARATTTALLLTAQFITSFLVCVALTQRLVLIARIRENVLVAAQEFRMSDLVIATGARLVLPLTAATATAFLLWLYRAYQNLGVYRGDALAFTPREAVQSFFIPFLNLFLPYRVVRELWLASDPAGPPLSRTDSPVERGSQLVLCWWVLFVARGIPGWGALLSDKTVGPQIERLTRASYHLLLSHLLAMPAALAAVAIVYLVDQRLDALAAALEGQARPKA